MNAVQEEVSPFVSLKPLDNFKRGRDNFQWGLQQHNQIILKRHREISNHVFGYKIRTFKLKHCLFLSNPNKTFLCLNLNHKYCVVKTSNPKMFQRKVNNLAIKLQ